MKPYLAVTVGVVAADSEEEAIIRFAEYVRVKTRLAVAAPRATPAELMELLEPPADRPRTWSGGALAGRPGTHRRLTYHSGGRAGFAGRPSTAANEIMLVPLAFDGLIRSAILRTVAAGLTRTVRTVPRHAPPLIATA